MRKRLQEKGGRRNQEEKSKNGIGLRRGRTREKSKENRQHEITR